MQGSLFKKHNFLLLWSGQAISLLGDDVFTTTLVLLITTSFARDQSWAPLAVSGIYFAEAVPILLIGPLAGVFADRWQKRSTMLRMDLLRTLIIVSLIPATALLQHLLTRQASLPLLAYLYLVIILESVCAQFFSPSRMALISEIVSDEERPRAMGMLQTTSNIAIVLGPPIGALLFFALGAVWSILLNAASFAISFGCIFMVQSVEIIKPRSVHQQRGKFWAELRTGIDYYIHNQILVILLVTGVIFMAGGSALNALAIFFVTDNLHLPAAFYTALTSATGIGAIIGAAVGSIVVKQLKLPQVLSCSLIGWGLLVLLFAHLTIFVPVLVIFFFLGGLNAGVNIAVGPLLIKNTPKPLIGRSVAVLTPAVTAASMLSTVIAGTLASTLKNLHFQLLAIYGGPIDTIFTVTGMLAILAGLYAHNSFQKLAKKQLPAASQG